MKKPAAAAGGISRLSELGSHMGQAQRLGILTAVMLLATGLIGMVTIQGPWQENRRQLGAQLDEEKQRSELLLSIQRQKGSLQKSEEELLMMDGGTPALTSEVSRLATESHLSVESVAPQSDVVAPPYTQFQIEIVATARLENLLNFLESIENHRPLLVLNEMEVGAPVEPGAPFVQTADNAPPPEPPEQQRIRMRIGALGRQKKSK